MDENDRVIADKVKGVLDSGLKQMEPQVLSRLRQARAQAVEAAQRRRRGALSWLRFPALGASAAGAAVLAAYLFMVQPAGVRNSIGMEDIEILASSETLDICLDPEFYLWLSEEEQNVG